MKKGLYILLFFLMYSLFARGQDPSFSQFFSSPLNINPALTANINADWRAISNFRDQWLGPASPFRTGTLSYDSKLFQNKYAVEGDDADSWAGAGGMLMYDYAMAGIVQSTYASANFSYRVKFAEGNAKHRLGAGFGGIYGYRRIDFNRIDFEEQFTGYGFNTNLPTGETSLSSMKPYFSVSAGILYSATSQKSNFDFGLGGFHLNRPKQTFLQDENQVLAARYVAHANFETFVNESVILNLNTIYQQQETASYYSVGGALGFSFPNDTRKMLNAGVWYWSKNAVVLYLGVLFGDFQFGASYDFTVSKLNEARNKPNTWELSLIIRGKKRQSYDVPCPWK